MMAFALQMAWRETRAAWRHFSFFLVCLAVGVGALTGVSLFGARVEQVVNQEARSLLGGDLEIWLTRPISQHGREVLDSLRDRGVTITHTTELVAMAANVSPSSIGQPTQIVELKAVEPQYPLYGSLRLEPHDTLAGLLNPPPHRCPALPCFGAVVQESLLIRMGLAVGDGIKIGQGWFLITSVVKSEPDRMANMFSLGPRVFLSQEGLRATDLIKLGSRIRERYLLKLPASLSAESLRTELQERLARESPRITDYRHAQPQLKQSLDQLTRYLGLIGLTALFVGGAGVATSVHAFVREKLITIGILKTMGADSSVILRIYVLQALILGLAGSILGLMIGMVLYRGLPGILTALIDPSLLDQLGIATEGMRISSFPLLKGLGLGILSSLLFALWPLMTIRDVKPAWIFRREVDPLHSSNIQGTSHRWIWGTPLDKVTVFSLTGIGLGLVLLAIWQAGSWKIGWLFILSFGAAVILLALAARFALFIFRRWQGFQSLPLRYAIGNIRRPGSQLVTITIAVGMGVMVMTTVALVEQSLIDQVDERRPADSPSFFFIDIQPDQAEALLHLLRERSSDKSPRLTPLVRARLSAIKGVPVSTDTAPDHEGQDNPAEEKKEARRKWFLTREYALTFLQDLPKENSIVQGEWWKPGQVFAKPLISIEEDAARQLGLSVGDSIEVDIHGTTVSGEISSIRHVEWGNFSTNFYMIFSPGSLDGAPLTYVATIRVPPSEEVPLQQAVVALFPNVTAINVGDVLNSFTQVVDRLSLAIQAVALFCVLSGGLVMAAALASTRYRRLYESLILKALGASRGLLARTFAIEYAILGIVGGLAGLLLASALSWAALSLIFDLSWNLQPMVLAGSFFITLTLTTVVGFLSTYRILGHPPLSILRYE
ncbi:MAG: FtsX-like permease family protein [Nitrospira sp.]|nr:FtsX-like permease family protein [Nitrospira sp.]MCP9442638.1 FtsX-like permease family protein [Nitrospira sp.]